MPQMADITVKKADGTTNITYVAKSPSSGDGVAAIWRADSVSTTPMFCPSLEVRSRYTSGRTGRKVQGVLYFPFFQNDAAGNPQLRSTLPFNFDFTIPKTVPTTVSDEAAAQAANLIASALVIAILKGGFSAS